MDLSTIEGLNLTAEQITQINAASQIDIDNATTGLVNKNNELLGEKKTALQTVTDSEKLLAESRQASAKLAEEKLLAEGKYAEALELREQQNAELTATANAATEKAQSALDNFHKGNALNSALSLIHDDYKDLAKAQLSNMIKIGYNDQGEVITTFESEGKVVANNVEEFKGWASEQSAFKKILNGVDSSGADTTQSRASGSSTSTTGLSSKNAQLVNAAIIANPKLKDLPLR